MDLPPATGDEEACLAAFGAGPIAAAVRVRLRLVHARVAGQGWFLLGPVAVLPALQRQGIGSAVVSAGLDELRVRGASGCALVGDPGFYGRFGICSYPGLTYEGVPDENVLCLPFGSAAPVGSVHAHGAFEIEADRGQAASNKQFEQTPRKAMLGLEGQQVRRGSTARRWAHRRSLRTEGDAMNRLAIGRARTAGNLSRACAHVPSISATNSIW